MNFKTALRNIQKHKLMTLINVVSLAIGISATLVIFLFVQHDYSFDKHVPDGDRVYRVNSVGTFKIPGVMLPLIKTMEEEATNIELVVPVIKTYLEKIAVPKAKSEDLQVFQKGNKLGFTNSKYFELYPSRWLAGDAKQLNEPQKIVLTESNKNRFFPGQTSQDVIGNTLIFMDSINLQVAGVVADFKENSDFSFQGFISMPTIPMFPSLKTIFAWDSWTNYNDINNVLVKIPEGTKPADVEKTIVELTKKNKKMNEGFEDKFMLQPLADVHFNSDFNYNASKPETLRNLILLAVFLLALGVINFINLSTAQSTERAKEIGIRKTLGSTKGKLTMQFLVETFLIALTATLLSIVLTPILLKAFDGFIPEGLEIANLFTPLAVVFLLGQLIIVTLLAGFYPAWILTGYSPVLAMKNQAGKNSNLSRSNWVRKLMTVFQFALAQVFLICVLIVVQQVKYVSQRDMGFEKDAVFTFFIPGSYQNAAKGNVLKNRIAQIPEVQKVSFGNHSPAVMGQMTTSVVLDQSDEKDTKQIDMRNGDENFLSVYDIPLVAGRNIIVRDSLQEVMINERSLEFFKFQNPQDALGKTFSDGQMTIVGVMKDFDMTTARQANRPIIYYGSSEGYVMHVRLDKQHPETWSKATDKISKEFNAVFPNDTFEFKFIDDTVESFYTKDKQLSKLLTWAMGLSILIAGLGLFGLGLFTANQRTKEIGIRKVLGASISQIIALLLKNLLSLVGIACLIAFPIAWYFGSKWLENFTYKMDINWWLFPLSALGLLLVATLILLSKTYFAAKANPVKSLRDE